ncbi:MAG: hypothetical protein KDE27_28915 [Planctomycetes bacterium]|nr:hypothetical protein [Planctomycetota bacterium]
MLRVLHLVGWLIAGALAGFAVAFGVIALCNEQVRGEGNLDVALGVAGLALGATAGGWLGERQWRSARSGRRRHDRTLWIGGLLLALGIAVAIVAFVAEGASGATARPGHAVPTGAGLLAVAMIAVVAAAVGGALLLAGAVGTAAERAATRADS